MRAKPIDDPDDPRLDAYARMRERDLVGRDGRFIVEGEVSLRLLFSPRARFRAESVLLLPERWPRLAEAIESSPAPPPVYLADKAVMTAVAGFPIHRGVLAVALRGVEPAPAALVADPPAAALVLGLAGLTNHDNVGAALRNAAAFGADVVLLDRASCDPLYRKSVRVSAGAALIQPFTRLGPDDDWLRFARKMELEVLALSPSAGACLDDVAVPARTLLIVGAEGPGLDTALLARTRSVRIPMVAGFDSLNVATAAGIALHVIASAQGRLGGGQH